MSISMRVLSFVIVILFTSNVFCGTGFSKPLHPLAQSICADDINYIFLKRRDNHANMPPLSIKGVFCIFAMLDKILGGDGLKDKKGKFWKDDETTDEELSTIYELQEIPDYMPEHLVSVTSSIPASQRSKYSIIVFSETFFSNNPVLDNTSVEHIMECCRELTLKHDELVICINFLHKYNLDDTLSWLPVRKVDYNPLKEEYICSTNKDKLLQNRTNHNRFSNYSVILWKGKVLSCYRKTVYMRENDSLAEQGYGFDFGDWNSYQSIETLDTSEEHSRLSELFNAGENQKICTRICADLHYMPYVPEDIKLLIIQANDAPSDWLKKFNVPTRCCFCDAAKGCCILKPQQQQNAQKIDTCPFVQNELHCEVYRFRLGSSI